MTADCTPTPLDRTLLTWPWRKLCKYGVNQKCGRMTGRGPFMELRQGPQLHKACSVRGAILCTVIVDEGQDRGTPPGSLSADGNKLGSVPISGKSPPTSLHNDMYINRSTLPHFLGPHMSTRTAYRKCDSKVTTHEALLVPLLIFLSRRKDSYKIHSQTHTHTVLASVIMKKSSPGSPWTTIFSPSSNWTGSRASATVKRSHLSKDSVNGQHMWISKRTVLIPLISRFTNMYLFMLRGLRGCLLLKSSKLVGMIIPSSGKSTHSTETITSQIPLPPPSHHGALWS